MTLLADKPAQAPKLFTAEGVERAVVFVKRVLIDVTLTHDDLVFARRAVERVDLGLEPVAGRPGEAEAEYQRLMDRLRELVAELELVGVTLVDFETGIVTFPTCTEHGDGVYVWSLRDGGPAVLTKPDLVHEIFPRAARALKGGVDA